MHTFLKDLTSRFYTSIENKGKTTLKDIATIEWAFSERFIEEDSLLAVLAQKLEALRKTDQLGKIWVDLIKKSPLKFTFSSYFAENIKRDDEGLSRQIKSAFECLYTQIPPKEVLANLIRKGINPRGAIGIFNNQILGWILSPKEKMPRIEFWYTDRLPVSVSKHYSIDESELLSIQITIPEDLLFGAVRVIEKNVGDYPGSPVFIDSFERVRVSLDGHSRSEVVNIVLPIYENCQGAIECLESLFLSKKACKTPFEVIVIHDGGTDKRLYEELLNLQEKGNINLINLDNNRGFISAVNEGFINCKGRDVVVLTSDTLVFSDWLDRLRETAYLDKKVGLVCPLTNKGEFFSYPHFKEIDGPIEGFETIDKVCKSLFTKKDNLEIPIAIGFCLYIKGDLLTKIGGLNGKVINRGYGEDVELSFRAKKAGFKIYLSPNVFVYHKANQSFGEIQKSLYAHQNNQAIEEIYPGYRENYLKYISKDPTGSIRRKLSINLIKPLDLLIVLPYRDRLDPFFELLKEISDSQKINIGFLITSEDGKMRFSPNYWSKFPIDPIDLELPKERKLLLQILDKVGLKRVIFYSYDEITLDLFEGLKLQRELLIGHLTPDLLSAVESGSLEQLLKGFSCVYVFSERMSNFLSKRHKKVQYFPLFNEKTLKDLLSFTKLPEKLPDDELSFIVSTPYDFENFKNLVQYVEANKNTYFFVNRLELWEGVTLKENLFPLISRLVENEETGRLLNLKGAILWQDDPEEAFVFGAYCKRNSLSFYKNEIYTQTYLW